MKSSSVLLAAGAAAVAIALSACDGLKEAMTAHVDTVARAGSQELSVDRLVALLNETKVPPRKEVAQAIANVWMDYQVLGAAAAKGDTVIQPQAIDSAMWTAIAGMKARKYVDMVSKTWNTSDTAGARRMYDSGEVLAASHILYLTRGKPDSVKAGAKRKAEALRSKATSANFAELAKKNSEDPGSAPRGGALGVFRKGQMVPTFEQALLALKPGQISPVIETEFGYHIIRRATYDEVKEQLLQASRGRAAQQAESVFVVNLQTSGKIQLRPNAGTLARAVMEDPDSHVKDDSPLATSTAGTFTASRMARWLQAMPAAAQQQQKVRMQGAPDSIVGNFVKQFVTNELVVKAAEDAKLGPTAQDMQKMRQSFIASRDASWLQLRIDPKSLADSAKTVGERERFAAARIDTYMDKLVSGQAQFVQVPDPISHLLRSQYGASINSSGLDHAVEKAIKAHAATDAARRAAEPPSVVPMPGEPQPGTAGGAAPGAPGAKTSGPQQKR
jgi:hypothetical protein